MNLTTTTRNFLLRLGCAALVCIVPLARAAVYDFAIGDPGNRSLRLNIPDGVPVVRGLLIYGNGAGSDYRSAATNPEFVAFAQSMGFAVVGTAYWSYFAYGYTPSEYSGWVYGLQQLAAMSGHPEIERAPWLPFGMSNGGQMSYSLNVLAPEKVIAMALNKAPYVNNPQPDYPALSTPGLLIAGQLDDPGYVSGIHDLYFNNRPRGALWAWAEEENTAHNTANSYELILPFMAEVYGMRYLSGASPQYFDVYLYSVTEKYGWLTDPDSYKTGLADIASYASYAKDKSVAGWLPNRRIAYIFRAFASYHKATASATLSSGSGPIDWGTTVTYDIGQPVAPWTSIEFYEGDVLLKRVTPAAGGSLALATTPTAPGYSVYHALVTFADGTQRTTIPRRVFVRTGTPQAPALGSVTGTTIVGVGGAATFAAPVTGYPMPVLQWRKDGVALLDGGNIFGATSSTLTISNVQGTDAGSYTLMATNALGSAASRAVQLVLLPAIQTQPSSQHLAPGGNATFNVMATTSVGSLTYQWKLNGTAIAGATSATFAVANVQAGNMGFYSVTVGNSNGTVDSDMAILTIAAGHSRLTGLSTRGYVPAGGALTPGFFLRGSGSKALVVRAVGPSLSGYGVASPLSDPRMDLIPVGGTTLLTNDDWGTNANLPALRAAMPFPLVEGSKDAAALTMLSTATSSGCTLRIVPSGTATAGIAMAEVYDLDATTSPVQFASLSTLGFTGTGENVLTPGFIITGDGPKQLLIRAVGSTLGVAPYNVPGMLSDPQFRVVPLGKDFTVASNDNWGGAAALQAAFAQTQAFALPADSRDAVAIVRLPPGGYTVQATGVGNATGNVLVEVYDMDP